MSLLHFFLSPIGRISRQAFWLGLVVLMAVTVPVSLLLDPGAAISTKQAPPLAATIWNLILTWPSAAISIKRFNDRDWPPWIGYQLGIAMAALILANHVGLLLDPDSMDPTEKLVFSVLLVFFMWAMIDNGFYKGTSGPNRHGPDPLAGQPQTTT